MRDIRFKKNWWKDSWKSSLHFILYE